MGNCKQRHKASHPGGFAAVLTLRVISSVSRDYVSSNEPNATQNSLLASDELIPENARSSISAPKVQVYGGGACGQSRGATKINFAVFSAEIERANANVTSAGIPDACCSILARLVTFAYFQVWESLENA